MKNKIKRIIRKTEDWLSYSCGRSTDYFDELDVEESIDELIKLIDAAYEEACSDDCKCEGTDSACPSYDSEKTKHNYD